MSGSSVGSCVVEIERYLSSMPTGSLQVAGQQKAIGSRELPPAALSQFTVGRTLHAASIDAADEALARSTEDLQQRIRDMEAEVQALEQANAERRKQQ